MKLRLKILRLNLLILNLLILELLSTGQNVTITGKAKGAEGKTIFLTAFSDRITFTEKKLASAKIDSSGQFSLKTNINEAILAYIIFNNYKAELYIEPGKQYEIRIVSSFQSDFSIDILNAKENDLNLVLSRFDAQYNDFVLNNFNKLLRSRHRAILDSFRIKTDSIFKIDNRQSDNKQKSNNLTYNLYFEDYIFYKIGALEFMSRLKSNTDIEKKYFYNKPILYENVEYMEFFNEFYKNYFTNSKYVNLTEIYNSINQNDRDYEQILQLIKKDTLIKEGLVEMVMLKELDELYYTKGYNKDNILYMIKDAEIKIKDAQNKQIAGNLYKLLTKLQTGSKAPDFKLTDTKGNKISLNVFKGKYIYLNFWKSNIKECLTEMQIISTLYDKYKNRIAFISICADSKEKTMKSFLTDNKNYKWTFAYFNNNRDLLNEYDIRIFPTFVFIDDESNINTYPAPKPSEQVQKLFDKIKN